MLAHAPLSLRFASQLHELRNLLRGPGFPRRPVSIQGPPDVLAQREPLIVRQSLPASMILGLHLDLEQPHRNYGNYPTGWPHIDGITTCKL